MLFLITIFECGIASGLLMLNVGQNIQKQMPCGDAIRMGYRKMDKNDRLAAGNTLRQYERAYTQAFDDAVKAVDPKWEPGKPIPSGALDGITRESIDNSLVQSGGSLVKKPSSGSTLDIQI